MTSGRRSDNVDPWFHRMEIVPGSTRVSETGEGWCIHFEVRQRCDPCMCELCCPAPIRPIEPSPDDLAFIEVRDLQVDAVAGIYRITPTKGLDDHAGESPVPSARAADDRRPASGV